MNQLPLFYHIPDDELTEEGQKRRLNRKKNDIGSNWKEYVSINQFIHFVVYEVL